MKVEKTKQGNGFASRTRHSAKEAKEIPGRRTFFVQFGGAAAALAAASFFEPAARAAAGSCSAFPRERKAEGQGAVDLRQHFIDYHLLSVDPYNGGMRVTYIADSDYNGATVTPCKSGGVKLMQQCPRPPCA